FYALLFLLIRLSPRSPLFPYTTLFRSTLESSRWLLEHLLEAEATDRAMRSISYQRRHGVHRAGAQRGVGRWPGHGQDAPGHGHRDRKSTRLNSSHVKISYAVFCLKKKK